MPNSKSAIKELRKSKSNAIYNKKIKDNVKSLVKKTKKAIDTKTSEAEALLKKSLKALDKAAQKGVIKKNTKDRKKSRLHKQFNKTVKASKTK